jgi:uncharacterized protein YecE (DUF72 family)
MGIWIGTSGYSYPEWVGGFYPAGSRSNGLLRHYCQSFPLVELNYTFYRPPTRAALVHLADKTPTGFQFLVKLPQTISHERQEYDLAGFRDAAEGLRARGRLLGVLAQFPQSCHCTRAACDWIARLARELGHLDLAIEFRHKSWNRPGLSDWLAEKGVGLVAVDVPDLHALFPRGWVQSTPTAYVRLHSRNAQNWHAGGGPRYDYDYSDAELKEWMDAAIDGHRSGRTGRSLFLFNNCSRGRAPFNARRMQEMVSQQAPELSAAPFVHPAREQRTLF